jgi:hypothetical protein
MDDKRKENEQQRADDSRPSSTSPVGGRTHEATKPPSKGDLDPRALEQSQAGLQLAAGGD